MEGDEPAIVDHLMDLLLVRPAGRLHLALLQGERGRIEVAGDGVDVIEADAEMDGHLRPVEGEVEAKFLLCLALGGGVAGVAGHGAASHGQIPHTRPAVFEGLALLDEHLPLAVEDEHVHHHVVAAVGHLLAPDERLAGLVQVAVVQVPEFHGHSPFACFSEQMVSTAEGAGFPVIKRQTRKIAAGFA